MSLNATRQIKLNTTLNETHLGLRLDQVLAQCFDDYSRSRIKSWIENGWVMVNKIPCTTPRTKMMGDEEIEINALIEEETRWQPEPIELDIIYEDAHLLVINKPTGLVVHPGAGCADGTLLNGLLHYCPSLAEVPRAGIIHRLDKDTTGLMVIAKSIPAQTKLVAMMQRRQITREYEAVVSGVLTGGGIVDKPIGRHTSKRTQMAVLTLGKPAITHYRVVQRYRAHTHLQLRLETGRTHQIRVHMASVKHPLVGDPVYGGRPRPPKGATEPLVTLLCQFGRQALHARMLSFEHPFTGQMLQWSVPRTADFDQLLTLLTEDYQLHLSELENDD